MEAQVRLAEIDSTEGGWKNFSEAARWYRKAAEHGDAAAQCMLGVYYVQGRGVPMDVVEGYKWLNIAATEGDTNAISQRDALQSKMTREQIAEGQRRSGDFLARKPKGPAAEP